MNRKPDVAIVGPGRLGGAIARELKAAGYPLREIVGRPRTKSLRQARALARKVRARALEIGERVDSRVVWICVPDSEIARVAEILKRRGDWQDRVVFHSSGALGARELKPLREAGASVAAVHPLMTFVSGTVPELDGVSFAVEGDPRAVRIAQRMVRDIGGRAVPIRADDKAAYHAWGAFTSPLLVALLVTAERVAKQAGISSSAARRRMRPILEQTLRNYYDVSPPMAFTGPLVRGDLETVRKHLLVLKKVPESLAVYEALAMSAMKHLPVANRKRLAQILRSRGERS
jgi:predicted short-subunit dehydrogenase-like oxidoreductase (DUF2520 family)